MVNPDLTARQLRVLDLVSLGQSQRQIARKLGMSETNVNVDLRRARIKLGAITTAHAVRIVVEAGMLRSNPLARINQTEVSNEGAGR